ncbi:hypothetical protein LJR125_002194 [Pseudoxanthomonas sp. LjRoot125]|jgi:hypothetical protein
MSHAPAHGHLYVVSMVKGPKLGGKPWTRLIARTFKFGRHDDAVA